MADRGEHNEFIRSKKIFDFQPSDNKPGWRSLTIR